MSVFLCPACGKAIPEADINVATDVAFCRACGKAHSFAGLVSGAELEPYAGRPVPGTWHESGGRGTVIGASHRSIGGALGILVFALFWNGIVSVFVVCAISGTLHLLGVPAPEWFPAPKMNGETMGTGMVLFLWLFLSPFIAIGAGMIFAFLMSLGGKTEVRIGGGMGDPGRIFTGIGPVGWSRRFDPRSVREVRIDSQTTRTRKGGTQTRTRIVLGQQDGKELTFGSMLPDERRKFVAATLRKALLGN